MNRDDCSHSSSDRPCKVKLKMGHLRRVQLVAYVEELIRFISYAMRSQHGGGMNLGYSSVIDAVCKSVVFELP